MNKLFIFLSVLIVALNLYVSSLVVKSVSFKFRQKIWILVFIWLVPFIGAALVYAFIKNEDEPNESDKTPFGGGSGEGIGATEGGSD